ncbi:hypothetical protein M409DRAFT_68170 [Zasmidium cellare ATCC 36951]|uniref:MADS-box domain-containing protein n=1 Tax=Zasmidium cellare ATCC 36951 TaxID=1080233 RepID=A0A6A6CCG4_ZASCE|nr:uncharacterized protein M409DRAFT_68170 [Zasmidium cellare ATCC 36951]KAF2163910.1 hypothetical protein M409DRAFT_68170 [Zasmidium cellare ATCC 36951]
MGRRKIEIKPIRDDRNRSVTFLKRKGGLFKKAHELSVLCSVDVAVVIFGHNKKLYEYSSSDINEIIGRFQYYGGAHEHKGPQDFADKHGGGDDDDDEEGGEDMAGGEERGTPAPDHPMMHPQMAHHPGFQHVRQGTPSGSPPMHNGQMPQFQRGPSPLPPGMSRPSSRNAQHPSQQQHIRRTSSNLVPQAHQPQPSYAYTPNPPFYNPQAQMQRPPGQPVPGQASYPPPYPPQAAPHPQMQQAYVHDNRRSSMPPAYPTGQPPPQANMQRHQSQEHLQPPHTQGQPSPQPQQAQRPTPSPQPVQQQFQSPPMPQPKPLPAHAKSHSIFTPIDDSRSMLAQHWGATTAADMPRSDPEIKIEGGGPRSASIDVAAMQRENQARANGLSPRPPHQMPPPKSPQPPQRTASQPTIPQPSRSNTNQSEKKPRLRVQIPSEQSGDEGGTAESGQGEEEGSSGAQGSGQQQGQPSHGVVLPPPSPSAGALLSAGAQGPPNPFARPAPPMSTNPHAANRDAANNHIETPISALPSRFMNDNLLPSPSSFYPEWGFGRSGDSNMLPSPLNFQTPVVSNGSGWREEERKRSSEDQEGGDAKRTKS